MVFFDSRGLVFSGGFLEGFKVSKRGEFHEIFDDWEALKLFQSGGSIMVCLEFNEGISLALFAIMWHVKVFEDDGWAFVGGHDTCNKCRKLFYFLNARDGQAINNEDITKVGVK